MSEKRSRSHSLAKLIRRKKSKKEKEDIPKVSFLELLKLNKPDWYLVLIGVIGSAILGVLFPMLAILFSNVLSVSELLVPISTYCSCFVLYYVSSICTCACVLCMCTM